MLHNYFAMWSADFSGDGRDTAVGKRWRSSNGKTPVRVNGSHHCWPSRERLLSDYDNHCMLTSKLTGTELWVLISLPLRCWSEIAPVFSLHALISVLRLVCIELDVKSWSIIKAEHWAYGESCLHLMMYILGFICKVICLLANIYTKVHWSCNVPA